MSMLLEILLYLCMALMLIFINGLSKVQYLTPDLIGYCFMKGLTLAC